MNGDDRELWRASALPTLPRPPGVLAVLVVYRRTLAQLESWQALREAMESVPAAGTLQVRQVLIYDNSPSRMVEGDSLPRGIQYYHDPTNGGTARAYATAATLAASESVEWVLLLDQDTRLPPGFFGAAGTALSRAVGRLPGALLPKVVHGTVVISPSLLTRWGSTRPLASRKGYSAAGLITGISSGAFVRADALKAIGQFPPNLWLDYVDHWLFSRLRARGEQILPFSAVVQHDLSIARPHCVDTNRFRSILDGEAIFIATLPAFARRTYRLRLLIRAVRLASRAPRHSTEILSRIVPWLFRARHGGPNGDLLPLVTASTPDSPAKTASSAVSVVMAVYNGSRFLGEQLASLLADLQPGDEVIVVDDASTDNSFALLQSLYDNRVKLVRNEANLGVLRSFERGLSMATSEFIFLCDQDDQWRAGKRRAFVEAFDDDELCLVVISDASLIDAESRQVADSFMTGRGGFRSGFWSNVMRNRYLGCAMAVRRRLLAAALPIPRHVPMHDMWLGILGGCLGNVTYLPKSWIAYRRHGANVTPSSRRGWRQMLIWRLQLLRALMTRLVVLAIDSNRNGLMREPS